MDAYTEIPTWLVEPGDECTNKWFWFRGEVVVEAYPDDEWHTDTLAKVDEPVQVFSYESDEAMAGGCMLNIGGWEVYDGEDFGGIWIGPLEFDELQQLAEETV